MSPRIRPHRPARLAAALLALTLLAAGCGGEQDEAPSPDEAAEVSDGGGASDGGDGSDGEGGSDGGGAGEDDGPEDAGASDDGGSAAAGVPADPYPVTPAPEDFESPAACTGEGAHLAEVGGDPAQPELPERAGETLTIELSDIDDDHAQLTAAIGSGTPRPIEDATVGETVTIDLWTISITSVCSDLDQVEFDLID